jgi:mono/diheme cytochrome c family protein
MNKQMLFVLCLGAAPALLAQPGANVDYNKQVQPIFNQSCTLCHKGSSAPAGLKLDSPAGLFAGSESGKVIIPGNAKESLLAQRISDTTGAQMPPTGSLKAADIATIVNWINQGAKADYTPVEISKTASAPAASKPLPTISSVSTAPQERAMLDAYCATCHSQNGSEPALSLDTLDLNHLEKNGDKWELVVRKMRAGMMPPSGRPRPSAQAYESMIAFLEKGLDRAAVPTLPPPGIHRMNRTEYANVVRDLLALEIDPSKFLPSDDSTRGFDNIAGALTISPALLEGYTVAAEKISRLAIGDVHEPSSKICRVPEDNSQDYHIDGMPFATRGGLLCNYEFPADGDYVFKLYPINQGLMDNNRAFGEIRGEKLELLVDGERVKLYDWDRELASGAAVHGGTPDLHFQVKAGPHTVIATFLATQLAPSNDLNEHFIRSTIETGGLPGFKFFPHVGKLEILGPNKPAGASESPSRRKIFTCNPASAAQETDCAKQILTTLARHAYRRPVTAKEVEMLMSFYQQGRKEGSFEIGVERGLERILADPEFVFRREIEPVNLAAGKSYRISDLELASRLSFFLWSSIPDDELLRLAGQNRLHDPVVLEQQVRRMLADPRSDQLVVNFAGQWLNLRSMQTVFPIPGIFPDFDDNLRLAMRKETEMFVSSIVHEDHSVLDLLNANYTFLNERLAQHYGLSGITGSNFRRITWPVEFDVRRGLLGHGSIETVSAYPNRTSPTVRGKTMMKIFLGVSPPDPPPNVPALKEGESAVHASGKPTMRQQMEQHRKVEPCATCHKIMDPIGFSLENYDAIGRWRTTDDGSPIDPAGQLVDGSKLDGVKGLREALLRYSPQFVRVVSENLMIYALGRGTDYYDMPLVRSIVRDAEKNNYRFSSLVLGVVKSEPFQMNQKVMSGNASNPLAEARAAQVNRAAR